MKQEQLKKLAEWSIDINDIEGESNFYKDDEGDYRFIDYRGIDYEFDPLDSNQLDMLKLKYIKEAKIGEAKIKYHSDGIRLIVRSVDVINTDTAFEKSENECWLIVILNYIENK